MTTKERFIEFLQRESVYQTFQHNIEGDANPNVNFRNLTEYYRWYIRQFDACEPFDFKFLVSYAFKWGYTKEEFGFWETINDKWQNECTKARNEQGEPTKGCEV